MLILIVCAIVLTIVFGLVAVCLRIIASMHESEDAGRHTAYLALSRVSGAAAHVTLAVGLVFGGMVHVSHL